MVEKFKEDLFVVTWRELILPLWAGVRELPRSRKIGLALASACFLGFVSGLATAWYEQNHGPEDPSSTKPKIVAAVAANHQDIHNAMIFAEYAVGASAATFLAAVSLPEMRRRREDLPGGLQIEIPPELPVPEV